MYPQIVHVPLLFHFHQPVGQFGWVYEEAYQKSYFPLISFLFHFPTVKANLHFSGPVLEWLDQNKPEFFETFILPMVKRKQIELVTGGYYEPVLISIPDEDKIIQIKKLNTYWSNKIGTSDPRGLWLTERVWEPGLVKPLSDSGVEWVLIDDENFELNTYGVRSSYYPVITEDQGTTIKVLAINEKIRYLIPWKPVQETFNFLKNVRDSTDPHLSFKPLIVIMTDAEKMGLWPAGERSTYDICYETGFTGKPWIQELFEMLDETTWISSCTISEYFDQYKNHQLHIAYFKTESYDKMGVWALPSDERRQIEKIKKEIRHKTAPEEIEKLNLYLKGGHWRSFIAKYTESNVLHKKMLFVRSIYEKHLKNACNSSEELGKGYDLVLQAQCNDVYWHGQFGGIYYRFMREYSHSCLIQALKIFENVYEKEKQKMLFENILLTPILLNGTNDAFINNSKLSAYISLADGGTLFSLDDKETNFNFLNTFTRIIEAYHPEKGIPAKGIVNDSANKWSFRDYFFSFEPKIHDFFQANVPKGSLFHNSPYEYLNMDQKEVSLTLRCISTFKERVLEIEKSFTLVDVNKILSVEYKITNLSDDEIKCYFVPEMNFILPGNDKKIQLGVNRARLVDYDQSRMYSYNKVSSIKLLNSELEKGFRIAFLSGSIPIHMFTILSHEYSETFEYTNYQGHCLIPSFKLSLPPLGSYKTKIELEIF